MFLQNRCQTGSRCRISHEDARVLHRIRHLDCLPIDLHHHLAPCTCILILLGMPNRSQSNRNGQKSIETAEKPSSASQKSRSTAPKPSDPHQNGPPRCSSGSSSASFPARGACAPGPHALESCGEARKSSLDPWSWPFWPYSPICTVNPIV